MVSVWKWKNCDLTLQRISLVRSCNASMLPAHNGEMHVCYGGLPARVGVALSTWGLGQALLKKLGLGHPERWWWVGWDQYWFRGKCGVFCSLLRQNLSLMLHWETHLALELTFQGVKFLSKAFFLRKAFFLPCCLLGILLLFSTSMRRRIVESSGWGGGRVKRKRSYLSLNLVERI